MANWKVLRVSVASPRLAVRLAFCAFSFDQLSGEKVDGENWVWFPPGIVPPLTGAAGNHLVSPSCGSGGSGFGQEARRTARIRQAGEIGFEQEGCSRQDGGVCPPGSRCPEAFVCREGIGGEARRVAGGCGPSPPVAPASPARRQSLDRTDLC